MSNITSALVKELRDLTGAGMMDCKKALQETGGVIQEAIDWLRKKGLSKAVRKQGRAATEGLVGAILGAQGKNGVVAEVNAETDFVARNEQFQDLVKKILACALTSAQGSGAMNIEDLSSKKFPAGETVAEALSLSIATIGENMNFRRATALSVPQGVVVRYLHNSVGKDLGKIAVLIAIESDHDDQSALETFGRQIAMHVAAASPLGMSVDTIPAELIDRERAVLKEKALESGKPQNVVDKIVENGVASFLKEVSLLEQPFVMDTSKTIQQVFKDFEKQLGATVKLANYVRFSLGEGLEKETSDFAEEVASMSSVK